MFASVLFWMIVAAAAVAVIHSSVFLVLNWENRRYWQRRQKRPRPEPSFFPRTLLVVPCKGVEKQMRENLTAFMQQDHPNYEVVFAIESWEDACVPMLRELIKRNPRLVARIKVGGTAKTCGQKVRNLRAATEKLNGRIEVIAFADTDAEPQNSSWLRWIVCDLGKTGIGARTGYRWFVPMKNNFASYAVSSINNSITAMMGRGTHLSVWGGSWAIHRRVFDSVAIRDAWSNALSDDMVVTRALRAAKLGVKFEPKCICKSEVKFSTTKMFEFLRRQFLIGRLHDRRYWWASFAILSVTQVGFWGSLIMGLVGTSSPTGLNLWLLAAASIYAIGVGRGVLRRKLGKIVVRGWGKQRRFMLFDSFAAPIVGVVTLIAMMSSLVGNKITWRGIHYDLGQSGRVMLIGRDVPQQVWDAIDSPSPVIIPMYSTVPPSKTAQNLASQTTVNKAA